MIYYYVVRRNSDNSIWGISRNPFPQIPKNMSEYLEGDFPLPPNNEKPIKLKDPLTQCPRLPNKTRFYMYSV